MSLSSPLVSLVSPNRGTALDGLCCTNSNRLKVYSNPVNSKCAGKERFCEWEETPCMWEKKLAEQQTVRGKENNIWRWKQVILTCHYGVKNMCPLLSTNRTAKGDRLVTCRVDGRNTRIGWKWSKTNQNKTRELTNIHGAPLEVSPFQLIHTIVVNLLQ